MLTSAHEPRLHRLEKIFTRTPLYFLTLCSHDRAQFLANEEIHAAFRTFCEHASPHGVFVGGYVIMPDHVHVFASIGESAVALSGWVKSLKNTLSKTLRQQNHPAPHWQKGFFDHLLRSADSYSQKWDYVLANPVRAGLTPSQDAWPFQGVIHDLRY
jgi:putative transposase